MNIHHRSAVSSVLAIALCGAMNVTASAGPTDLPFFPVTVNVANSCTLTISDTNPTFTPSRKGLTAGTYSGSDNQKTVDLVYECNGSSFPDVLLKSTKMEAGNRRLMTKGGLGDGQGIPYFIRNFGYTGVQGNAALDETSGPLGGVIQGNKKTITLYLYLDPDKWGGVFAARNGKALPPGIYSDTVTVISAF